MDPVWARHAMCESALSWTTYTVLHTVLLSRGNSTWNYHFSSVVTETLRNVSGQWLKGMEDRSTGYTF